MARPAVADPGPSEKELLQEALRLAGVSRDHRRAQALALKQWYDLGTPDGQAALYNKLRSHLDRLASFLWSPDAVRFAVHLPPASRALWLQAAGIARDEFRQAWADSGADLAVSLALEWALVYGSIPLKVQADPTQGFVVTAFDPWDFGVTREDQPGLDDQDTVVHWYALSLPQFRRWVAGHARESALIAEAEAKKQTLKSATTGQALIITG